MGIIGTIGCGKSTLLKMMVGLYRQNKGQITLDGVAMQQLDPCFVRDKVFLLEQNPAFFWELCVKICSFRVFREACRMWI